jgi:serine/threonine-protein kinase HipA
MKRIIRVFLGESERPIGTLRFEVQGNRESGSFEYDALWLSAADRFNIDPTLALVAGPQFHRKTRTGSAFHSVVADTAPDGWGRRVILRDHAKRRQAAEQARRPFETRPLNSLDFLLAVDDTSRVGALRFRDEKGVFCRKSEPNRRATPPLIELGALLAATRAVETNSETASDLRYLLGRGTSLGGLRPKCSVIDDDGSLSIGKFPSVSDERAVTKGEVLALHLAARAGIKAAAAKLVDSDGIPVAVVRRFDRALDGRRLMFASAATMLAAADDDGSEHTYGEIVDVLRTNGASAQEDIEELWRRIAFSILITNTDDHLRNHGFLHVEREKWRLAPAFDINPFPDRARELKTWISEEAGPHATVDALMSFAPYCRIPTDKARALLGAVEDAVRHWREAGRSIGMTSVELDQFADAFEHAERGAARRTLGNHLATPELRRPASPSPRARGAAPGSGRRRGRSAS